jgi:hypothetical protein
MTGLVRVAVGALMLVAYLTLGVARSWWLAITLGLVTAGIAAAVQGRAENARWGGFALGLAVVAAHEVRRGMTQTGRLIIGLLVWITLSQIMQWLATSSDPPSESLSTSERRAKRRKTQ